MSTTVGEMLVKVRPDTQGFSDDLDKGVSQAGDRAAQSFGQSFASRWGRLDMGTIIAGGVLGDAVKSFVSSASDLNETVSKTSVIFGDGADEILRWSESSATAIGLSQTAALEAAGNFQRAIANTGAATAEEASKMSTDLVQLAGDMASFNNTSVDDAVFALSAALRGETEPIRRYGVFLNDATLKAKALEMGIYSGEGALTIAQKSAASYALILEQTSTAQGDFARTSDGVANQSRILAAQWENTKATLGKALLPAVQQVLGAFNGLLQMFMGLSPETQKLITMVIAGAAAFLLFGRIALFLVANIIKVGQAIMTVSKFLSANPWLLLIAAVVLLAIVIYKNWDTIKKVVGDAIDWITDKIGVFVGWVQGVWNTVWGAIGGTVTTVWNTIVTVIQTAVDVIATIISTYINIWVTTFTTAWDIIVGVFNTAKAVIEGIIGGITSIINGIGDAINGVKDIVSGAWDWIVGKFIWAKDMIIEVVGQIKEAVKDALGPVGGLISTVGGVIGNIPGFDTGGVVPGAKGSPQLILAHGGETILPTHKQPASDFVGGGGGGMSVAGPLLVVENVQVRSDQDITRLARELAVEADRIARGEGRR